MDTISLCLRHSAQWMLLACLSGAAVPMVHAQQSEEVIEEIVVTGSRISRGTVFDGKAPVQTVDAQVLETSGVTQPVDILKNITANSGSVLANEQTELQGTTQFSLRSLGLSSTLTLINGRRPGVAPIGDAAGNSFFDINTLPLSMIERVEVLRDGASAIYGSEAIAGVANIITRKGFEGFEVSGTFRDASHDSYDISFAMGVGGDRGHFNLYGSHYNADENFRTDMDFVRERIYDPEGNGNLLAGSLTSAIGGPGSYQRAVVAPDGSATGFPGTTFSPDADCEAAGGVLGGPICRSDFADSRTTIAAEERWQLFAEGDFQLTDRITVFAEGSASQNIVTDRIGAQTFNASNVDGIGGSLIPANHPFS